MTVRRPSPGLLLITLISVAAFTGLAAWAWGDLPGLLAHPLRLAGLAVIWVAAAASLFSGIHLGGCVRPDSHGQWRLAPLALLSLGIAAVPPLCDRRGWLTIDGDAARAAGLALLVLGAVGRVGPMFVLGDRFTWPLAGQVRTPLRTTGFYRWVRHPSYAGAWVGGIGWSLLFRSWAGLALVAALIPFFLPVIRAEEESLLAEYGESYANFRRQTWMLIPFLV